MVEKTKEFNIDKEKNFSEWYTEVLKRAELIDQRYEAKGFLVHRPNAAITEELMYRIYEEELEKKGHKRAIFPSVIPESFFEKEKEHVKEFEPNVFWVTHGANTKFEEKLALRPTSETAMYTMYAKWIRSHRDLPLKIYQSCQVWRYETKATRPLLRDREFYWIEAHDVFATREEAEKQVMEDLEMVENIVHKIFGVPFLYFKRPEWDKFPGAVYTFGTDGLYPNGKVRQLPSTHLLGQNFSKVFGIKFLDKNEKEQYAWQTCYGPAISTIYSALIAVHGDNKGIIMPWDLAAIQIVIIPIPAKGKEKQILEKCKELEKKCKEYRVVLDNSDKSPGEKFNEYELKGACLRFEIGQKELTDKSITIHRRDMGKRETTKESDLGKYLKTIGEKILENMIAKADKKFEGHITNAKTMDELKKALDKGGFVRVDFCSREADGEKCADVLKAETEGGEVRGTLHGKNEKASGNCVVCDKKAKVVVYIARAY